MQFSKGDRVRVKRSTAWSEAGATGTVVQLDKSMALVTFDNAYPGTWWAMPSEIEKVEEGKPTGPTPFNNGDRVRIKEAAWFRPGDTGTVRWCGESTVHVVLDGPQEEVGEYSFARVEKIEGAKPTDSIQVDNIVNHPPHYTGFSNGAEVIDITENLPFNRGNAIKYLARAGKKNADRELEDLKKALWYVAREIERMEKEESK